LSREDAAANLELLPPLRGFVLVDNDTVSPQPPNDELIVQSKTIEWGWGRRFPKLKSSKEHGEITCAC
jgi:hypothetical protein